MLTFFISPVRFEVQYCERTRTIDNAVNSARRREKPDSNRISQTD